MNMLRLQKECIAEKTKIYHHVSKCAVTTNVPMLLGNFPTFRDTSVIKPGSTGFLPSRNKTQNAASLLI